MFSRARDASKVALAHLVARLRVGGYRLLDCQFLTEHLASLGAIEVPRDAYIGLLGDALAAGDGPGTGADFGALDRLADVLPPAGESDTRVVAGPISGWVIAQLLGQTS
jgi:leucyl/phenylalanyl-tRNA--protein transferase